ncbi:hypothetical protein L6164_003175 [Bauhinia variegata]|uniref:Uncharacterized protein n=1 Tax=Bauhinia variegata TaxID=167791 RepID=A0ACB9Q137_BAUVA|nr:hypothetical protein L6164_003175 [Bauhinia variegata]
MRHVRDDRSEIGSDRGGPKMEQEEIPLCSDKPNTLASVQSQSTEKVIFPNLKRLRIKLANKLSCYVPLYRSLKTLEVNGCNSISKLPPLDVLENLEELKVEYCNSIKVIFDTEGTRKTGTQSVVKTSHLRKLTLHWLPKLKHVWNKDPQEFVDFQCLSVMKVFKCDRLKYLFPVSVAKALVKLQRLEIKHCCKLETIVGTIEKGADGSINFVFSQVTILIVVDLPKLARFYSGACSTEWPRLQELCYYRDWNTLVSGIPEFEKFHCQDGLDESVQLPLPMEKREKPNNQIKIEEHEEVKVKNMSANMVEGKISVGPESRDTDLQTSTNEVSNLSPPLAAISQVYQSSGNMLSGIDLSEAEDTIKDFPSTLEVSYKVPRKEGKNKHLVENLNYDASSSGEIKPQLLPSVPKNKGENVEGKAQETAQKDPTSEKLELEIIEKLPKSELVLIDQQHALEENKGDPIKLDAVTP